MACFAALIYVQLSSSAQPTATTNRFVFREPQRAGYVVIEAGSPGLAGVAPAGWLKARPDSNPASAVELGSRIVVQLKSAADLPRLINGRPLQLARALGAGVFILQAPDAWVALHQAQALAELPEVSVSCPVVRQPVSLHGAYAAKPNDPYFSDQWHLENRDSNGVPAGVDLNVRAAWPVTRGEGIVIAIADEGVDLDHPDLASRAAATLHFNFGTGEPDGRPLTSDADHGTAVAGLAAAEGGNGRGIAGVAPQARFASWVVLGSFGLSDEEFMDVYQFQSNVVAVQNHSWGINNGAQNAMRLLESIGVSNAVNHGRSDRGVVFVRSGGNGKGGANNANDYGLANDPQVIAVAAVRFDGRVTSYSQRGACLLVAAPSADSAVDFPTIFTTDRRGSLGYNQNSYTNDLADYAFGTNGFSGTSASAPQISGLVALLLSANTNLTLRDLQQVLILSSRHFDLADHALTTNGAGFRVSHNVGFGVPDAGVAVRMARNWINRPALTNVTVAANNRQLIPDDGLLKISGTDVPTNLVHPRVIPSLGPQPNEPTLELPLVDVGMATNSITADLTGKIALIRRGTNFFRDKIENAAAAGAAFAIIYNNRDTNQLVVMAATDFTPIPAVFIGQTDGENLRDLVQTNDSIRAQLRYNATGVSYALSVNETLICEHVAVRVATTHQRRGDLRITLTSPQGTRSMLQDVNLDDNAGPTDWTYYSTQHFYESSAGTWKVFISDEQFGNTGLVQLVELSIRGVPIIDTDHDGLDDGWEMAHLRTLALGPTDDPDGDGYSNAREQILGTDPLAVDVPFQLDLSRLNENLARLSWPGTTNQQYEVLVGTNSAGTFLPATNLLGKFPETEWLTPYTNSAPKFFRVRIAAP